MQPKELDPITNQAVSKLIFAEKIRTKEPLLAAVLKRQAFELLRKDTKPRFKK
jgi:hypothetical protein